MTSPNQRRPQSHWLRRGAIGALALALSLHRWGWWPLAVVAGLLAVLRALKALTSRHPEILIVAYTVLEIAGVALLFWLWP